MLSFEWVFPFSSRSHAILVVKDEPAKRMHYSCCLDNLVKGGAGQAIQNMNLMMGFPEETGLEGLAVYP